MKYDFTYNDITIPYEIIRKNVKNINIRIRPNGEMIVSCNYDVGNKEIELLMTKRANWIFNTINEYKQKKIVFSDINYKLVDGEEFLLLGKVLRIKNYISKQFKVNFDNNYLYIYRDNSIIDSKFDKWYKDYTRETYNRILDNIYRKFKKYDLTKPILKIVKMKTRWGTCNTVKKVITLNRELIKVDEFLIEFVLTHEMVHFIYKNHDKNFWNFLTMLMPDWKEREKILYSIFIK